MEKAPPDPPEPAPELDSGLPRADRAIRRALDRLAETQESDGCWDGDYSGLNFLLPMLVSLHWISNTPIPGSRRDAMVRELLAVQNPDGGLGLHIEGASCQFASSLGYVALRLLGESPERGELRRMRTWIRDHGTPLLSAPWGKWVLCPLGLYQYRGLLPVPPAAWLLPRWLPFHPGRLWCHNRMVYLPLAWLWGRRPEVGAKGKDGNEGKKGDERKKETDEKVEKDRAKLIAALREELYGQPWESIDFARHRLDADENDALLPVRWPARLAFAAVRLVEALLPASVRARALEEVERQIDYEDRVTHGIGLGPVNRILNTLCHHFRDPGGEGFRTGLAAIEEYLWESDGRCRMRVYNNSRLWDTAFALQAAAAAGAGDSHPEILRGAHRYLEANQVRDELPDAERHYRDPVQGGWPFSNLPHGWPITDCTAEGVKSAHLLGEWDPDHAIPRERLEQAVRLLLRWQNPEGGWATYEKRRAGAWLEVFNVSGVFARIMVDHSCIECTSAVLQALCRTRERDSNCCPGGIERALVRGERWLRGQQGRDGSWEGSWAVCYTYGAWFAVSGLKALGVPGSDPALRRSCEFLLARQHEDGGWGEEIESCLERRWIDRPGGHVVQTAWALMSLLRAEDPDRGAQDRAAAFLLERQEADGGWPDEGMVGMFNRTGAIRYDWYRLVFPLWALAEWRETGAPIPGLAAARKD